MQECLSGLSEGFSRDGEGESQYLQSVVHVFLAHIGHEASLAKRMYACQTPHNILRDTRDLREKRDGSEVFSSSVAPVAHVLPASLTLYQ